MHTNITSRIGSLKSDASRKASNNPGPRCVRRTREMEIEDGLDNADLTPFWAGDCEHAEHEQPILMNTVFGTQEVVAA